jgi:adenosylmethionine-8-amino-7-oxononanoate aminotransferase
MDDQHAASGDNQSAMFFWPLPDRQFVSHGEGIYLYDDQGRRYIDASSGPQTANIGHADPRVVAAMQEQAAKVSYAFPNHFRNEPAEGLARDIADLSPFDLDRVFFCSGGSEAVEASVKLARQYAVATGEGSRYKIISRLPSYHGSTLGALSLTGDPAFFSLFSPMMVNQPKVPAPFCHYRPEGETADQAALRFADTLQEAIENQGAETVLAFIMEPIGGAATGALTAPKAYYTRVREICDHYGVLLIFDEVMSGSGRSGKFLAAEHWNVRPDIVVLAKGLGAGYTPLGACLTSSRILAAVEAAGGFMHGHTYSANPLSCAVGRAVLGVMRDDGLIENAAKMGARLKHALHDIAADYRFIGEVKGEGLLLGFDVVADSRTGKALPPELMAHEKISQAAYDRGLIIYSRRIFGGIKGDQFLVSPPLIVNEADVNEIAGLLREALDAFLPDAAPYLP